MLKNHRVIRFSVPLIIVLLFSWSCTDLIEEPFDLVTPDNFYNTEAELTAAVVPVYNGLAQAQWGDYIHLQSVSADDIVVPTRGGDWDDGGVWRARSAAQLGRTLGLLAAAGQVALVL